MKPDTTWPAKAQRPEVPGLTGLRFFAAFSVAVAHGTETILRFDHPAIRATYWLPQIAGFGMCLFFVLSGFVIHYNYRIPVSEGGINGIGGFFWARFSRLYPLYFFVLLLDVLLGRKLYQSMVGNYQPFFEVLRSLPYDLTLTQTWIYKAFSSNSLVYVTGIDSGVTWSISTEWFFYLAYPLVALFVIRARRPWIVGVATAFWCAVWIVLVIAIYEREPAINSWAIARYGAIADLREMQDSFFRWLMYFSPYLRIGEFILGCLIAQLYVLLQGKNPTALERSLGGILLMCGIVSVLLLTYLMYGRMHGGPVAFIRMLNFNFGLAPSIAIILFCVARYKTSISCLLESRPIRALGEASYSIYLFHFLILVVPASFIGGTLPGTALYIVYSLSKLVFLLGAIMLVALGFHAYLEVPSRQWLRNLWRDRSAQETRFVAYTIFASPAIAALTLFFAIAPSSVSSNSSIKHGIRTLMATYGANCGAPLGNATRAIQERCNGRDHCHYVIDVRALGDPASGCAKDFVMDYQCVPDEKRRSVHIPAEAGLGSHLDLSCKLDTKATRLSPKVQVKPAGVGGR
jgi:peptidoglycan/LPS O-acetylase OafA/YrhL